MDVFLGKMGHFGNAISGLHRPNLVDEEQGLSSCYLCSNAQDQFG